MTFTEEQVLNGVSRGPEWLYSESEQRAMLKRLGLKETPPNIHGWTTLERIPPKPMFPHSPFERTRKDNAAEPEQITTEEMLRKRPGCTDRTVAEQANKTITAVEQERIKAHYASAILKRYRRDATRPE